MEYVFILGRSYDLCRAELTAVFKREDINYQLLYSSKEIFHIKTDKKLDVASLIKILGGTVKISQVFAFLKKPFKKSEFLDKILTEITKKRKNFGLSYYGKSLTNFEIIDLTKKIKILLKDKGINKDYVLPTENLIISNVVIAKRKIFEINIIEEDNQYIFSETLVIFDFEEWNKRDFKRPFVNPKKGMLPPKVARMMVNLATGNLELRTKDIRLLDPFCGMGTILAEGLMVGYNVVGSDIDKEAVNKTKSNLEWVKKEFSIFNFSARGGPAFGWQFSIFISDATHISERLERESIDAIITEPYLGPLIETKSAIGGSAFGGNLELMTKNNKKITPEYLKDIITGLEKLYIGCLKDWWKILKSSGVVVIIIPSFKISDTQRFSVEKPIDICEKLGYNLVAGSYQYSRPKAVVIRNIYILEKSKIKNQNARPP